MTAETSLVKPDYCDSVLEQLLLERAKAGEQEACERLLHMHHGLFWMVVHRYRRTCLSEADCESAASLGFTKAARNFKPHLGVKFATYAVDCMKKNIRRYLVREIRYRQRNKSLTVKGRDDEGTEQRAVADTRACTTAGTTKQHEDRAQLARLLCKLPGNERCLLEQYYGIDQLPQSLRQLGREYGTSPDRIKERIGRALRRLRTVSKRTPSPR